MGGKKAHGILESSLQCYGKGVGVGKQEGFIMNSHKFSCSKAKIRRVHVCLCFWSSGMCNIPPFNSRAGKKQMNLDKTDVSKKYCASII